MHLQHPLALLLTAFFCAAWIAAPQPVHAQPEIPPLTGRVMDPADILSSSTERTLTDMLRAHEDSTGNQIVIATVPSLQGEAIEEYALRAGRSWQIGTAEHDNGLLLVVAPSDRKVRIEVGYGLEGAVPDAVAAQIIRKEILPEFRDGDFDAGVVAGTLAILEAVKGEYVVETSSSGGSGSPPIAVRIIFVLVFGVVLGVTGFSALTAKTRLARWIAMIFLSPFAFMVGGFAGMSFWTGLMAFVIYVGLFIFLSGKPAVQRLRERMAEAAKKGERVPVAVGPFTMHVGGSSGSGGGSSFGGGGGGFSGGGGSFGGGGASGGW